MDPEGMMKAGRSQDSFLKESLLGEEEEDYIVDEVEQGNAAALAQPLLDGQQVESPLSGPLNPWRHLGLRMQSPHQDMTILPLTVGPLSLMARNLGTVVLRVVGKDPVDPDQHGRPGKINPPASGA